MNVLFTAVGSIGTRHVNNLTSVCKERGVDVSIDVIRYTDRKLDNDLLCKIKCEIRNKSEIQNDYDVVFITDETMTHYQNIMYFKNRCKHMFIEKPIFSDTTYNLSDISPKDPSSIYYVAAPIRFSDYYRELKDIVTNNDIYSARIIFSSYMPNWQKGRDYRKSFRCYSERGGGVDIDSLHDIDYMTALFGKPIDVKRVAGKYSNLEMNAPDIATYLFTYPDKIVEVHLDYFGRYPNRRVELFAKDDVFIVDFNKNSVLKQREATERRFDTGGDFYVREMNYFVDIITSGGTIENINSIENAYMNLKLAKGII